MRIIHHIILAFFSSSVLPAQEQIIPKPVSLEYIGGPSCSINLTTRIIVDTSDTELLKAAQTMQHILKQGTGYPLKIEDRSRLKNENDISIIRDLNLLKKSPEAYSIRTGRMNIEKGITIHVASGKGAINALASLIQMLPSDFHKNTPNKMRLSWQVSNRPFYLEDYPRFAWRGLLLDEARYFYGVAAVKQLLDQMHLLKMNVLHWHLTDDVGWRIEIKRYPKLTEIGSKRSDTEIGTWGSGKYKGEAESGFYTQEQIKEIVAYASARNITIIPEIDIPAHSSAAAVAYPELSLKAPEAVPTSFTINTAIDPTKDFSYLFYTHVFEELAQLFPSAYLHMGGDEAQYEAQWAGVPAIETFMKKHKLNNYEDVQRVFTIKMNQAIQSLGRRTIAWNEILHKGDHSTEESSPALDPSIIIHYWVGKEEGIKAAIEAGHDVINASSNFTYLARSYKNIPLAKAYGFDPVISGLSPAQEKKILGLSCQMWNEWAPTDKRMHYQVFPRIIAYAETGWSPKTHKDFTDFRQRLESYLPRLELTKIGYAHDHLEALHRADFAKAPLLGSWCIEGKQATTLRFPSNEYIKDAGTYVISFIYDGGKVPVDIKSVTLLKNGEEISVDNHDSYCDMIKMGEQYKLQLHQPYSESEYEIVIRLEQKNESKSQGSIFIEKNP